MNQHYIIRLGFVFALNALMISASCSSDKYQNIVPKAAIGDTTNTCNTVGMSYLNDIVPILNAECLSCHTSGNPAGDGIVLDNYLDVKRYGNSMVNRITKPTSDGLFMPKGGGSIGTCKIDKIKAWITQGALNN